MNMSFIHHSRTLPVPIQRLHELSHNLWYSWNESALELFAMISPRHWEEIDHNPVQLLHEIDESILSTLSARKEFIEAYQLVCAQFDTYMSSDSWFQQQFPNIHDCTVAYFCAEFGFHESLPMYSGGLGILAGDHCKSASDLGIPLVGIGLLYRKGYFNQKISLEGDQQIHLHRYDFSKLPLQLVLHEGTPLMVYVDIADQQIALRIWVAHVGKVNVFLLDADHDGNSERSRASTLQLYGGDQEMRLTQEIILGMGGRKALHALRIVPLVYHINEGHAAFLTIERMIELIERDVPFLTAVEIVKASTVFTTHTPVAAGHDSFPMDIVESYLHRACSKIPADQHELLQLGYDESTGLFNMTHLALQMSSFRNGVSKLHGAVSREMFRPFHGNIEASEVPIDAITNGVHLQTWLALEWKQLIQAYIPANDIIEQSNPQFWTCIDHIPDALMWDVHMKLKQRMIEHIRQNLIARLQRYPSTSVEIHQVNQFLSPHILTIGFARRFATYKRATLIFSDLERLRHLVCHPDKPIQLVFAGKAHPADQHGQEMIRAIYRISQREEFLGKIIILENYDIRIARFLVQGVDVWLNNPRRPYEASGTSGQKAAMNGVLNFSILDGWWEEGFNGANGWAITSTDIDSDQDLDQENTETIYHMLEHEIIPRYYSGDDSHHPWIHT
jgi:starch phosphorylase